MTVARAPLVITIVGCLAVLLPAAAKPPTWLVWNASQSAPIGLYAVRRARKLAVGDLLVVRPPAPLAEWLAGRGYLPAGVPLLKHVAALPEQRVCRSRDRVSIDRKLAVRALDRDHMGRPLPVWMGCVTLTPTQVFLLNPQRRDSLDSRYFGPLPATTIVGRAHAIWLRSDSR